MIAFNVLNEEEKLRDDSLWTRWKSFDTFSRQWLTKRNDSLRFWFADNPEVHSGSSLLFQSEALLLMRSFSKECCLVAYVCIEIHLTCVPTPVQQPATVLDNSFFSFFLHFLLDRRRVIKRPRPINQVQFYAH